jgi:molecular chaperone GrpE (heat shock protein)
MSIADMEEMENIIDEATDSFEDKMKQLFDEVGEEMLGVTDQLDWSAQVCCAAEVLRKRLQDAVENVENELKAGEFK